MKNPHLRPRRFHLAGPLLLVLGLGLPAAAAAEHEEGGSYGYLRVLDGPATLIQVGSSTRTEAVANQPLLPGDRLYLPSGSRAEAILPDGSLLRLDGGTEVELTGLAGSPEGPEGGTYLHLSEGTFQLVVVAPVPADELLRIDTANATVYLQAEGTYLVEADRYGFSRVVVRDGAAELLTRRGSLVVRDGEQAVVEGESGGRSTVEVASGWTGFERWAEQLEEEAAAADLGYVDDSLRYQASSLGDYGRWVNVDSRPAWRPRVAAGWRPYTDGYWHTTPAGLAWVSYEPWGWVPYHYGTWDYAPGWGWVWYPGRVWSPAWVYWYWSPRYVGWCPIGYYTHHYFPHHRRGFRFGHYGWAGGDWGLFGEWSFLPTDRLRHRDQARYVRPSYVLGKELGREAMPRGLITTDTRGITPAVLEKPEEAVRALVTRPGRSAGAAVELPDVKPFIARAELPPEVARQVLETKPDAGRILATPLSPGGDSGEAKPQLGRRPLRVAGPEAGAEPGKPEITRRPVRVDGAAEAESWRKPQLETRPALGSRPVQGGEDGKPDLERRPARIEGSEGGTRPGRPTLERRPAPAPGSPAVESEAKPAPDRPPRAGAAGSTEGGGRTVRPARPQAAEDKPAARPERPAGEPRRPAEDEEKPPAAGAGVRIERRPAAVTPSRPTPRYSGVPGAGGQASALRVRPASPSPPATSYRPTPAPRSYRPPTAVRPPGAGVSPYRAPSAHPPAPRRNPAPSPSRATVEPRRAPSPQPMVEAGGPPAPRSAAPGGRAGGDAKGRGASSARGARPPREKD